MKREILFKGKRVDNGEWVFGFLMQDNFIRRKISCLRNGKKRIAYSQHEVHSETVCQFTGLLDKNGNKIFEGDKIIFDSPKIKQVVEYRKGQFMAKQIGTVGSYIGLGYCDWEKHVEIIGNIHD